jgi:polyisoprenoid-binding protein YceI
MQKLTVFIAALMLAASACAQQQLVPAQSEINFSVKQMGVPLDGKFSKFDAKLAFDSKNPEAGKIAFSIDLGSAVVGDAETTRELKKPEWFHYAKFPTATFASTAIKSISPGKLEVAGTLTIKGHVRSVVVPVTLTPGTAGVTTAQGSFNLQRVDFKIGEGDWSDVSLLANNVVVKFKLALTGV